MKTKKEVVKEVFMKCIFLVGASVKFDRDFQTFKAIISKGIEALTAVDRIKLIMLYNVAFHDDGKIEDIASYDSTATNCAFCQAMRAAAAKDPAHICNFCYDKKQEESFKGINIINRHTLNMLIMSLVEFTEEELQLITCSKINRVNSSGDVPNVIYAKNMLRLAAINKYAFFSMWAKNTAAVKAACWEVGKPENMTLVQSSKRINHPDPLEEFFDYVFTVYVNEEETRKAIAAGAGECNGKKCKECGFKCYLNGWQPGQNIAELLRTDKKTREALERHLWLAK